MIKSWEDAHSSYNWTVDLGDFKYKENYKGYFNQIIRKATTSSFEDKFRSSLEKLETFVTAGEVYFWKNHIYPNSHEKTNELLKLLAQEENWAKFVYGLAELATSPTFKNIDAFRNACGQPYGFASPVTFLSFYKPDDYPMVDRRIGLWWNENITDFKESFTKFDQKDNGTLELTEQNWNAYLEWTDFCGEYSILLNLESTMHWRARDVEMAVWEAQKRKIPLYDPVRKGRGNKASEPELEKTHFGFSDEEWRKKMERIRDSEVLK